MSFDFNSPFLANRRAASRNKHLESEYPLAAGIPTIIEIRRFPPRICLNVSLLLFACANSPRARKVLLLPGGYHRQAVDIKDPFYISAVAG